MSVTTRIISALFTTFPALFWLVAALLSIQDQYYWPVYLLAFVVLLTVSLLLGFFGPLFFQKLLPRYPWAWVFLQGALAWGIGLATLGLLNLTPLCIGQNNGDGSNDLSLCILYTGLVALVYSPVEFFLLGLSSAFSEVVMRALHRLQESTL